VLIKECRSGFGEIRPQLREFSPAAHVEDVRELKPQWSTVPDDGTAHNASTKQTSGACIRPRHIGTSGRALDSAFPDSTSDLSWWRVTLRP
jgi:hypothetical protein